MDSKQSLRKDAKEIRKSLDIESLSEKIVSNIRSCIHYINARNVMIFYPIGHETDLRELLNDDKQFYLPKVDGENLLVCPYKRDDKLIESGFKTQEPLTEPVNPNVLDLIFVPALMVDKRGYRLGYGGGFYDKFLSKYALKATKVVAISSDLIIEELPIESFDEKVDIVISEFSSTR